ncbi:hypothetical protein [Fulvivirga sediminis]|uniref:Uncharacterized protein n=1 Tax=Fulvivirga sediminis TaxID=2803949 RepID=A0A937K302_9BACT|nr:hypothetical protein [Fulvivirga sediminis]MBL3658422.1 hypothetical protein [Fulvivirga sediminis]
MSLIKQFIVQVGIRKKLAELALPSLGSNGGYDPKQIVESFWLSIWMEFMQETFKPAYARQKVVFIRADSSFTPKTSCYIWKKNTLITLWLYICILN